MEKPSRIQKFFRDVPIIWIVFLGIVLGLGTGYGITTSPKPQIVFVIDDLGYNKRWAELLFSIEPALTVAVLPKLPYSKYFAEEGKKNGFEILLHQPMQPEDEHADPGPGLITIDMTVEQIKNNFRENLSTVPHVVGVNNHMGSRGTKDRRLMYVLAKELKEKNLFFLDSMTDPKSVAYDVAFALGIPTTRRDVFLDNQDDYNAVLRQIEETADFAKENGTAVAIGHIRENTLRALKEAIPKLQQQGFEIKTLGSVLDDRVSQDNI